MHVAATLRLSLPCYVSEKWPRDQRSVPLHEIDAATLLILHEKRHNLEWRALGGKTSKCKASQYRAVLFDDSVILFFLKLSRDPLILVFRYFILEQLREKFSLLCAKQSWWLDNIFQDSLLRNISNFFFYIKFYNSSYIYNVYKNYVILSLILLSEIWIIFLC